MTYSHKLPAHFCRTLSVTKPFVFAQTCPSLCRAMFTPLASFCGPSITARTPTGSSAPFVSFTVRDVSGPMLCALFFAHQPVDLSTPEQLQRSNWKEWDRKLKKPPLQTSSNFSKTAGTSSFGKMYSLMVAGCLCKPIGLYFSHHDTIHPCLLPSRLA